MPIPVTTNIYMKYFTNEILKILNESNEGIMKISRIDSNGNMRSQDTIDFNRGVIESSHYDERGHIYDEEWLDISRLPVLQIEQVVNNNIVSNNISREEEQQEIVPENNDEINEIIDILTEIEQLQQKQDEEIQYSVEEKMIKTEKQLENVIECVICIEKIDIVNNCVTPCGHKFCLKCILLTCSRNASCPLCRSVLIPEATNTNYEYYNVFGGSTRLDRTLEYDFAIRNWGIGRPITERVDDEANITNTQETDNLDEIPPYVWFDHNR